MSRNQSKRSVAPTYVLQEKTDLYHMIRNSIVKSLSNMKLRVLGDWTPVLLIMGCVV